MLSKEWLETYEPDILNCRHCANKNDCDVDDRENSISCPELDREFWEPDEETKAYLRRMEDSLGEYDAVAGIDYPLTLSVYGR